MQKAEGLTTVNNDIIMAFCKFQYRGEGVW